MRVEQKHVVLYVGHLYKPFWTKKCLPGWQGGPGVPYIVLHLLCPTRTSGGYSRPSEVRFRAIFAVSGDLFYKAKHTFRDNFPGWHGPILRLKFFEF